MSKRMPQVDEQGTTAVLNDDQFKDYLCGVIGDMVKKDLGRLLPQRRAKRVFDRIVELIFLRVVETGYFRFPSGYGSLKLTKLRENAVVRTMPDGHLVKPKPERYKIRYKDGVAVMEMLGTSPHTYKRKTPRRSAVDADVATV